MKKTNQKYIIIIAGVVILLIIFIVSILIPQASRKQTVSISPSSSGNSEAVNKAAIPTISLAPLASNAKDATKQFYLYYTSSSKNPLANGAFKTNPYLSSDFKETIADAYKNGNVPLFCTQNIRSNIVVGQEQQVYYNNGYITEEVISEAPPGTKNLYNVLLEQVNGKWMIMDINCL